MLSRSADFLIFDLLGLDSETKLGTALHFFVYDTLKIFLLLAVMIFAVGFVRTWLPQHRLKSWMSKGGIAGNFVAALFGAITPFCSCSSIPIFISLLKAGVPLGVTFSFLITSPIINEYLVILMAGEFGLPVTIAYVGSGLLIGTFSGGLLGKMKLRKYLEKDMSDVSIDETTGNHSLETRLLAGVRESFTVIRQIWVWVIVGVGIGAFIHNYIPRETIHGLMAATGIFSVPIATALAFMMAMAALSLPEAIMLRRTMHLQLIAIYFGITAAAIVFTGYLLNAFAKFL